MVFIQALNLNITVMALLTDVLLMIMMMKMMYDIEQCVPFDPSCYPDGANSAMYLICRHLVLLIGLELMITSIKRKNWDNILVKQSPTK